MLCIIQVTISAARIYTLNPPPITKAQKGTRCFFLDFILHSTFITSPPNHVLKFNLCSHGLLYLQ